MYKSITINGQPIKRVVSNGVTVWSKASGIFVYEIAIHVVDSNGHDLSANYVIYENGVDKYSGSKINPYFYGEIKNLTKISLTPKKNASQIMIRLNSGAIRQNHTGPYLAGQKYEFTF